MSTYGVHATVVFTNEKGSITREIPTFYIQAENDKSAHIKALAIVAPFYDCVPDVEPHIYVTNLAGEEV